MATSGRIVAALASGSQETTIALANINFDFSLVRVEAPPTFQGVGRLLSGKRKVAAESGSSHVTARKLGALFHDTLPRTPNLIERYGSRASEIAQSSEKPEYSKISYGMFAEQAGIDATSIWAAATSGVSAISVHLLACMLARMFPGPEATSIWAELIEERKKELASDDPSKPWHISTFLAAQISVSRDQLAEWDNSARAWLRVADEVKNIHQTQLLLIIKNINIPVNKEKDSLYLSVMSAWKRALILMENLLCGTAQCVTIYEGNGDLLLALTSWHIYPDMDVLGSHKVSQKDPLVPSEAILTLGIESSPAKQDTGVYWSLPLAHYRFYGPPKVAEHSLCTDTERLSIEQFSLVVLGSFLSGWNFEDHDIPFYVRMVIHIYEYLEETFAELGPKYMESLDVDPSWLKALSEAGKIFLDSNDMDNAMCHRLIGVGMRRGQDFVRRQPQLFGILSFNDFYAMLDGVEHKIQAIRRLADRVDTTDDGALIRYRNPIYNKDGSLCESQNTSSNDSFDQSQPIISTDVGVITDSRDDAENNRQSKQDQIWIGVNYKPVSPKDLDSVNSIYVGATLTTMPRDFFAYASIEPQDRSSTKRSYEGTEVSNFRHKRWVAHIGGSKLAEQKPNEDISDLEELDIRWSRDEHIERKDWELITVQIGDPQECAIFALGEQRSWCEEIIPEDIQWALESGAFNRLKLAESLLEGKGLSNLTFEKEHLVARRALAKVFTLYGQLTRPTVALKIIEMPLMEQQWVKRSRFGSQGTLALKLNRARIFALLAAFETGSLNLDPSTLSMVMAMSSGDSIFVAAQLLVDPLDTQNLKPSSICRIRGNIGKPGVAMLVPPPEPQVKSRNSTDWAVINHAPFNGEMMDCFEGTSLHLSFTEYNRALNIGVHGLRDAEIYFLEAYVSVSFKGQWIGDADIISAIESDELHIFDHQSSESHACKDITKDLGAFRAVSIDNWDEFLDNPRDCAVVRAKDNWLARLSATVLNVQRKHRTIVLRPDDSICWACITRRLSFDSKVEGYTLIC